MGKQKRLRRETNAEKRAKRWDPVLDVIQFYPISGYREFFARSSKYLLNEKFWDVGLRSPLGTDHGNLREMLIAFAEQNKNRMLYSAEAAIERSVTACLRRSKNKRYCRKSLGRFTGEMMLLVKRSFNAKVNRDRARCMPHFTKCLKTKFVDKDGQ